MRAHTTKAVTLMVVLTASTAWAVEGLPWVLTSGWPTVVDVRALRSVKVDDPTHATAVLLDAEQLLLVGGAPGQTRITVVSDDGETVERGLTVVRGQTFFASTGLLAARVGAPRRVRVPGLTRVIAGDASLCDAVPVSDDELELRPRRPGVALVLVWAGGLTRAHRRELLVDITSGDVRHSVDDDDALVTEPLDGRLVLVAGESALLPAPQVTRVAVGDPSVVRVHAAAGGELVVEALARGATRLYVWTTGPRPQARFVVVHAHVPGEPPVEDDGGPSPKPPVDRAPRL